MIKEFYSFPVYYYSNHNSVQTSRVIEVPERLKAKLDFELEIAIIIGKDGMNIDACSADEIFWV